MPKEKKNTQKPIQQVFWKTNAFNGPSIIIVYGKPSLQKNSSFSHVKFQGCIRWWDGNVVFVGLHVLSQKNVAHIPYWIVEQHGLKFVEWEGSQLLILNNKLRTVWNVNFFFKLWINLTKRIIVLSHRYPQYTGIHATRV